jgi:hypothetical protein
LSYLDVVTRHEPLEALASLEGHQIHRAARLLADARDEVACAEQRVEEARRSASRAEARYAEMASAEASRLASGQATAGDLLAAAAYGSRVREGLLGLRGLVGSLECQLLEARRQEEHALRALQEARGRRDLLEARIVSAERHRRERRDGHEHDDLVGHRAAAQRQERGGR